MAAAHPPTVTAPAARPFSRSPALAGTRHGPKPVHEGKPATLGAWKPTTLGSRALDTSSFFRIIEPVPSFVSSPLTRARLLMPPFAAVVAVASLGAPSARAQQPSFGPLTYEEGAPLQRLGFTAAMEDADPVPAGAWALELVNAYSNVFEQDSTATHVLFLDMERLITGLTVRWGAAESIEIGARLTLETTGPGVLDGLVMGWHERLGLGQANRDRFDQDQYRQWLADGDGAVFIDKPRQTFGLHDARLSVKWRAWRSEDGRSALSLRSVARLPAVDDARGNAHVDGALMALWRQGVGSWYVHGMAGASGTRPSDRLDPVLRASSFFGGLGVERSLGGSVAALGQFQVQSAALRSFDHREIDRAPTNLILGLAGRFGDAWSWDASFQEDVPADTPAVDFTATIRLTRHW